MKILLILISFFFVTNVKALEINSNNAILYNMNEDTVIFEKNPDEEVSIASLTKIMTTIVALENIDNLDEKVTITYDALEGLIEANASVAGFYLNQTVTYRDLLYGIMLPSGADATKAIAINISGSEENFVALMNEKAKELGLTHTHFNNTSGLDTDNHYSTVREVSILLKYALKNPDFKELYTTKTYVTSDNSLSFTSTFKNYLNRYSIEADYIYGAKTGYTDNAGLCLSSIANFDNVEYLLVTTNADSTKNMPLHVMDAKTIYEYYFNNYHYLDIINTNDTLVTLDTKYATDKKFEIKQDKTISKYLDKKITKSDLKYEYIGDSLVTPFTEEKQIGVLNISYDNNILESIPVIYNGNINFSLFNYLLENIYLIILPLIFIILFIFLKGLKHANKKNRSRVSTN